MEHKESLIAEWVQSVKGAWALAQFNPLGLAYFDMSAEGFWKSFWAMAVAAPLFLASLYVGQEAARLNDLPSTLLPSLISYALHLPLTAFIMIYFTRYMKIDANYAPMIITYNWSTVITYLVTVPVHLLIMTGVVRPDVGILMTMIVSGYVYIYRWFVFKVSLQISGWLSIGVLLFQQLFVLTVDMILIRVLSPDYFGYMTKGL
ncbi:hypothetical protein [Luteithermobacter gelatinilyticus]|uniref:hypothetical protein n=1 Tax=Luteithermobacter gelatinilyticus TaxID=2582913 RepID=UPI001107043F|nr:hypothetical protein [Luteithermobacter gelatinilyticus]